MDLWLKLAAQQFSRFEVVGILKVRSDLHVRLSYSSISDLLSFLGHVGTLSSHQGNDD